MAEEPVRKRPNNGVKNPWLNVAYHIKLALTQDQSQVIIGPQGSTITGIRQQTSATLKVTDRHCYFPGTEMSVMVIGGEEDQVRAALPLVLQAIAPEDTMYFVVPSDTAGALIGKGGETVKGLRATYSCSIKILDGQAERLVQVGGGLGPIQGVAEAILNQLLQHPDIASYAHVDYAQGGKGMGDMGGKGAAKGGYGAPMQVMPGHQPVSMGMPPMNDRVANHPVLLTLAIPVEFTACVIGKGGILVQNVKQKTGCRISISAKETAVDGFQSVTIEGRLVAAQDALALIVALWSDGQAGKQGKGDGMKGAGKGAGAGRALPGPPRTGVGYAHAGPSLAQW